MDIERSEARWWMGEREVLSDVVEERVENLSGKGVVEKVQSNIVAENVKWEKYER